MSQMMEKISNSEIKKLANSYDLPILQRLGFENISSRGVQQACPIHQGDNPFAFSFDRNKMCWSCFTHGCHKKYGNDIIGLVRAVKDLAYQGAIDWIIETINDPEATAGYTAQEKTFIANPPNKVLEESILDNLSAEFSSLSDRGFSESTMINFQCGVPKNPVKMQHQRLMIPIRNTEGLLVGFTGRSIYKKCERTGGYHPDWANSDGKYTAVFSKWKHYPKGLNKSSELYNFHEAKKWIERVGFVVVVEGPFDVWRFWELGVKNCVATFGCSISRDQFEKLAKTHCKCLAVAFDDDLAGDSGFEKAKILFSDKLVVEKLFLPENKDPGALSKEDYNTIIKPQLSVLRKRHENKINNNNR